MTDDIERNISQKSVFENQEILTKILSNVRPQLQDYRLVCRTWNDVIVLRLLPKRVKLSFNFEPRSYVNRRSHFEAQVVRVQNLRIQNFCVMLSPRNLPREAITDINWFMSNFGAQMKSVDLTFWLINPASYVMLGNICKKLVSIEEMILKVTISHDLSKWPGPLEPVKKVGFKTVDLSKGCVEQPLVLNLMKLFPNAERLTIFPPKFCCHAYSCLSRGLIQLPKLREAHLWLDEGSVEKSVKILDGLALLSNNLERLELEYFPGFEKKLGTALEKVLTRYGPSLRVLRLGGLKGATNTNDDEPVQLCFPRFPMLRRFKICVDYGGQLAATEAQLKFKFPSDKIITYANDFPMLEDLEIDTDFGETGPPSDPFPGYVAEAFLPNVVMIKRNTCVKIKRAEFNIPEEWMQTRNASWGKTFLEKFQHAFPNASLIPMEKLVAWIGRERI